MDKKLKAELMTEITMALSNAYCTKKNEKKELDIDLVNAMGEEVIKRLPKIDEIIFKYLYRKK